jgi:hypothetical protein
MVHYWFDSTLFINQLVFEIIADFMTIPNPFSILIRKFPDENLRYEILVINRSDI